MGNALNYDGDDNPYRSPEAGEPPNSPHAPVWCDSEQFNGVRAYLRSQGIEVSEIDRLVTIADIALRDERAPEKRGWDYLRDRVALLGCGAVAAIVMMLLALGCVFVSMMFSGGFR